MNIALADASGHQGRGIGVYTKHLVKYLKLDYPQHRFLVSATPARESADLVHYPYFDFFFPSLPLRHPQPVVVTIHDVIPLIFPHHFPRGIKGRVHFIRQRLALLSVPAVITDSAVSAADITSYLGIAPGRIHPIHLAPADGLRPAPLSEISRFRRDHRLPAAPLLGYVGDINYNKNLPRLIAAIKPINNVHLAIVTRADLNQPIPEAQAIRQAIASHRLTDRVRFLHLPDTPSLSLFYQSLDFYIQPSLSEGFGLPLLEAMSLATPVLAAQAGSLPEVAGSAPIYFDPESPPAITRAISQALALTKSQRQQMSKVSTQQAKKYSWHHTAKKTFELYQSLISK